MEDFGMREDSTNEIYMLCTMSEQLEVYEENKAILLKILQNKNWKIFRSGKNRETEDEVTACW